MLRSYELVIPVLELVTPVLAHLGWVRTSLDGLG